MTVSDLIVEATDRWIRGFGPGFFYSRLIEFAGFARDREPPVAGDVVTLKEVRLGHTPVIRQREDD